MSAAVSVVIPTYNGSAFLAEALESVFAQSLLPREIIAVDDVSSDNTAALLDEFAAHSPVPFRTVRLKQNSGGPAHPLNVGIDLATTEYVAVLEQDDRMSPLRLERQLAAASVAPAAAVVSGRFVIRGRSQEETERVWGQPQFAHVASAAVPYPGMFVVPAAAAFEALLRKQFMVSNSSLLIRKDAWSAVGGYRPSVRTCCDLDFLLRVTSRYSVAVVDDLVLEYRWSEDSLYRRAEDRSSIETLCVRLGHAFRQRGALHPEFARLYSISRGKLRLSWRARDRSSMSRILREYLVSGILADRVLHKTKCGLDATWVGCRDRALQLASMPLFRRVTKD